METGRLFLMPLSKKVIQDKELSIHIFKDGFSFCTPDARPFFPLESDKIEPNNILEKIVASHAFEDNEKIVGIHFDQPATFVPKMLFNPAEKETYLSYNVSLEKDQIISENQTDDDLIKILFPLNNKIESALKPHFKDISFKHYSKILYDLCTASEADEDNTAMNIHLQNDRFDLFVFKNNKLMMFNTYPCLNEDSFLYFVMAVAEDLSLSPEAFNIVFFGKYNRFNKYYTALKSYHEKISFSDEQDTLIFDEKNHPAPYFLNLIA